MGIEQKIEQMYKALDDMDVTDRLPSVKAQFARVGGELYAAYDFGKGADTATAANRVSQLLAISPASRTTSRCGATGTASRSRGTH